MCTSSEWGARCSAPCAGANGEDDMNDLQGFWRLPVWVESSGFSRGTDGFNTDCMGGCTVKGLMPEHKYLLCPLDRLPRDDRSVASEAVGTLTGPHAWQGFSSGLYTNLRFTLYEKRYRHTIGLFLRNSPITAAIIFISQWLSTSYLLKKKRARNSTNGNILQHSGRIRVQHAVRVAAWARPLITPSGTLFCVKATAALYLVSILISLSPVWWGNVHRGQPRDKEGDTERRRERTLAREEKIRGEINVTRTRELY